MRDDGIHVLLMQTFLSLYSSANNFLFSFKLVAPPCSTCLSRNLVAESTVSGETHHFPTRTSQTTNAKRQKGKNLKNPFHHFVATKTENFSFVYLLVKTRDFKYWDLMFSVLSVSLKFYCLVNIFPPHWKHSFQIQFE